MPVDIELSTLTAGGVKEIRADWTETARNLVSDAIERQLAGHDDRLITYTAPQDPEEQQEHAQILKLHGLVGQTIMLYSVLPAAVPPTKKDRFEWSLGEEVTRLRHTSDAEYALFVYIRDSYATAGRKALMVTSALLGVGVSGGSQIGFCTLVDLHDGSIIWFNRIANQTGDLRTKASAYTAVAELMADIPL
jgi:hypothetical protein